jgi:hypothetical protein
MVRMMNGFRLGVGFQCIGIMQGAFSMAKEYAQVRKTMGKPILEHELIADLFYGMETDILGLRALAYSAVSQFEIAQREEIYLDFDQRSDPKPQAQERRQENKKRKRTVRKLTPLLKYLGAEKAVELCRLNMQIHGGFGYTKDYEAERLLRDALVLPVYEGTSQIQALMTLKDELKDILNAPLSFLFLSFKSFFYFLPWYSAPQRKFKKMNYLLYRSFKKIFWGLIQQKRKKIRKEKGGVLNLQFLAFKKWNPKNDYAFALLHAERICRMVTHTEIARILAQQASQFPERKPVFHRYVTKALPEMFADALVIEEGSLAVLDWISHEQQKHL